MSKGDNIIINASGVHMKDIVIGEKVNGMAEVLLISNNIKVKAKETKEDRRWCSSYNVIPN